MLDWKGTKVVVSVYKKMGKSPPVWEESFATLLDTDTVSDLFSRYDPGRYQFVIIPA